MFTNRLTLYVEDRIKHLSKRIIIKFPTVYSYKNLFSSLPGILRSLKCYSKITRNSVDFAAGKNGNTLIKDWDGVIVDGDIIKVIIYDMSVHRYAIYLDSPDYFMSSVNMDKLYMHAYRLLRDNPNFPPMKVYIVDGKYNKLQLLDVLDSGERYYNSCLTRLTMKYMLKINTLDVFK